MFRFKHHNKRIKSHLLLVTGIFLFNSSQFFTANAKDKLIKPTLYTEAHNLMKPNKYTGIDSMLIFQKNQLVSENYYGDFTDKTTHRTHSTFKSITALITLLAIDQGLLSTEEAVMPLLKVFGKPEGNDPRKNRIKIKNLLNMTSGISCDEAPGKYGPNHEWGVDEGPTPLEYSMNIEMSAEPGEQWHYCSANSFMLAAVVSAALNRSGREDIFKFTDKYLMKPLGIVNYRFTHSNNGQFLNGQGNAHFLPKDLAKFGLLVLNKGQWQGKIIIPEALINLIYDSSHDINWSFLGNNDSNSNIKTTYAYQWYKSVFDLERRKINVIHSWGNGGQYIFVIPDLQSVVVFTGSNQGNFDKQKQPFEIMLKYVLPELMKSHP